MVSWSSWPVFLTTTVVVGVKKVPLLKYSISFLEQATIVKKWSKNVCTLYPFCFFLIAKILAKPSSGPKTHKRNGQTIIDLPPSVVACGGHVHCSSRGSFHYWLKKTYTIIDRTSQLAWHRVLISTFWHGHCHSGSNGDLVLMQANLLQLIPSTCDCMILMNS